MLVIELSVFYRRIRCDMRYVFRVSAESSSAAFMKAGLNSMLVSCDYCC